MSIKVDQHLRSALNTGTTLSSRFWLSLATVLQGFDFLLRDSSVCTPVALLFLLTGSVGVWRVLASRPRSLVAWGTNFLTVALWGIVVLSRVTTAGPTSALSVHMVWLLVAIWCVLRTEATWRDKETV